MDDWEVSAEELDSLERDALKQLAERNSSSAAATTSYSNTSNSSVPCFRPGIVPSSRSPAKPAFLSCPPPTNHTINASPPVTRMLPSSVTSKLTDDPSKKQQPKVTVKLFLHASGNIAARFPYDQELVGYFRNITKASWNAKERLWMFPLSSLSTVEKVLSGGVPGSSLELENLDPLVRRAIAASSALPDLRDRYDLIPNFIESKLLPFQRDGIRFILQHGVRVLLADEMGLGKTLQAIAVTSCIRDSWPVLVLTPSSLRLQWASMIQQWLDIPSSDILVVLSQWSGSNRGGFNIITSNTRKSIHLDGVFNIISYDIVQKLQDVLMASEFKMLRLVFSQASFPPGDVVLLVFTLSSDYFAWKTSLLNMFLGHAIVEPGTLQ